MNFNKTTLNGSERRKFRKHWKKYSKTLSRSKAIRFLVQSFKDMEAGEVMNMYDGWRKEYMESEEW